MRRFYAGLFFDVCQALGSWTASKDPKSGPDEAHRTDQANKGESYLHPLREFGMAASGASLKKIIDHLKNDKASYFDIAAASEEFLGRLYDEANARLYFALTPRESDYFISPFSGWELSTQRFPEIVGDVEEAAKCIAVSRFAGSVFHSTQIVEVVLIELGKFLKVADPKSGWTAVSSALNKVIKKDHRDRTRFEKKNFAFLEQVHGTVEGLKNAWRNKISHSQGKLFLLRAILAQRSPKKFSSRRELSQEGWPKACHLLPRRRVFPKHRERAVSARGLAEGSSYPICLVGICRASTHAGG